MNQVSLFLNPAVGSDTAGTPDRESAGAGESTEDFAALFGNLLSRPLSSQTRQLLREFGQDPRLEGALREAGLGSDALRLLGELGLDEKGPMIFKGMGEVDTVDRSLDDVSRELKQRVERVQDRMLAEFGHEVRVVETYRSQERQLELYAQGRTAPGPVVTWTQRSAHTEGLAVDVIVDGGYDNEQAFERLQRIAREEGLKTLGPSDRGHLELDRNAAVSAEGRPGRGLAVAAAVARVAATARIATPGNLDATMDDPAPAGSVESPAGDRPRPPLVKVPRPYIPDVPWMPDAPQVDTPRPVTGREAPTEVDVLITRSEVAAGTAARASTESSGHESKQDHRFGRGAADRIREISVSPEPLASPASEDPLEGIFRKDPIADSSAPSISGKAASAAEAVVRGETVERMSGADAIERVAQIRDLQLDGRTHRVSRLVLDIADGVDSLGKLDITARGDVINARIAANQPSLAEQLRAHVVELQQGLVGRGLQPDVLQVRDAQILDALRFAGAAGSTTAGAELSTARSETGRGSSDGAGSHRDNHAGDLDRNNTNDPRSKDGRNARREDGRRDR